MREFRKAYALSARVISIVRWRPTVALAAAVAIAAIGSALFQSGAEPACAQGQSCSPGTLNKTTICHHPPGNSQSRETRCVSNSAVAAHLAEHPGDREGACPGVPTMSVCAPVTVTALHGNGFLGNSRLARIEAGKVPCLNVETAEKADC